MENISEAVLLCMISIASIQFAIIFSILKFHKKEEEEIITNKQNLIELFNTSAGSFPDR